MTLYLEDLQIVELATVRVKQHITNLPVKDAVVEVREHLSQLGDFNGNGVVDDDDLDMIGEAFGSYPGHPRWREECDLNKDGIIDINDLSIAAHHYGMRQGDVEPLDIILTDREGLANFGELPSGKYFVTVSKNGYKTKSTTTEFPGTLDVSLWPIMAIGAGVIVAVTCVGILAGTKAAHWW